MFTYCVSVSNERAASLRVARCEFASLRVCYLRVASLQVYEYASLRVYESTFGYSKIRLNIGYPKIE